MRKQSARMLLLSRPQGGERDGGTEAGISTANVSASMSALKEAAQADAQAAVEDLESWMEQEEDRIQKMERVAEFSLIESFYQQEVESQRNVIIKVSRNSNLPSFPPGALLPPAMHHCCYQCLTLPCCSVSFSEE
jgi:hypothetical protein